MKRERVATMKAVLAALPVTFAFVLPSAFGDDEPVRKYQEYLKALSAVQFRCEVKDRIAERNEKFSNGYFQEWKLDLGRRHAWRMTSPGMILDNDELVVREDLDKFETLLTQSTLYDVTIDSQTAGVRMMTSVADVEAGIWHERAGLGYLSYAFGYVIDDGRSIYLPSLLEECDITWDESSVTLRRESDSLYVLLELLPERGWCPRRLVYEVRESLPSAEKSRQSGRRIRYEVDEYQVVGDTSFPSSCSVEDYRGPVVRELPANVQLTNGKLLVTGPDSSSGARVFSKPARTLIAEVELADVSLVEFSDDEFELRTEIEDGTPVGVENALHLDYVWLDGEVVARADAMPVLLGDERFNPGPPNSPLVMIVANLVVIVLLVVACWYRKRSRV